MWEWGGLCVRCMPQDAQDVEFLMQCLLVGIPPPHIELVKNAEPPMNVMFEVGTDRAAKIVNKGHLIKYKEVLIAIGRRFKDRVPGKVTCRDALEKLDDKFENKLSHARMRKNKGVLVASKSDKYSWAKDNGDSLSRLMAWTWRLLCRTKASKDPDVQAIKDAWKSSKPGGDAPGTDDPKAGKGDDAQGIDNPEASEGDNEEGEEEAEEEKEDNSDAEHVEADGHPDSGPPPSTLDLVRAAAARSEATHTYCRCWFPLPFPWNAFAKSRLCIKASRRRAMETMICGRQGVAVIQSFPCFNTPKSTSKKAHSGLRSFLKWIRKVSSRGWGWVAV
jgi:hypothetical protein